MVKSEFLCSKSLLASILTHRTNQIIFSYTQFGVTGDQTMSTSAYSSPVTMVNTKSTVAYCKKANLFLQAQEIWIS